MHSPTIAIIGSGFSGIGMAVKLARSGIRTFTVYDRLADAGGCWRANSYPGAEVDTESDVYRYSFKRYPWKRTHARREELLAYFDEVIDDYELRDHMRFSTAISAIRWDDRDRLYVLTTEAGDRFTADVVISAVGLFNEPQIPSWPGMDDFAGHVVHSAQWHPGVELTGKAVAVVGTGSSSASIVPAIVDHVRELLVFQREPGWVLPKPVVEFAEAERHRRATWFSAHLHRAQALYRIRRAIKGGKAKQVGTAQNRAVQATAQRYLASTLGDRPDLVRALTPDYPVYGKRLVRSSDFYPALGREHVRLVPRAIRAMTPTGVVDEQGETHNVDVLVLATGFAASRFLSGLDVHGPGGRVLHGDIWDGDPSAFLGIMVPGLPNFFMIYGPNTNGSGAHLFVLECQMDFILGAVKGMARRGAETVEVRSSHVRRYERWLSRQWTNSALLTTHNYFRSSTGAVVTNWPRGFGLYYALTKAGRWLSVRYAGRRAATAPTVPMATDLDAIPIGSVGLVDQ